MKRESGERTWEDEERCPEGEEKQAREKGVGGNEATKGEVVSSRGRRQKDREVEVERKSKSKPERKRANTEGQTG